MRVRSLAASGCLVTALAFGVAACGGNDDKSSSGGGGGGGRTALTIYSSLPLQGDSRPQSTDVVNGEKLALEEQGGKVGKFTIKYVSLDDATASAGKWDPGQTSAVVNYPSPTVSILGSPHPALSRPLSVTCDPP